MAPQTSLLFGGGLPLNCYEETLSTVLGCMDQSEQEKHVPTQAEPWHSWTSPGERGALQSRGSPSLWLREMPGLTHGL